MDPDLLEAAIRNACKRAIDAEPDLTKWDTIMGDGDCGEGVKEVCQGNIFLLFPLLNLKQSLLTPTQPKSNLNPQQS